MDYGLVAAAAAFSAAVVSGGALYLLLRRYREGSLEAVEQVREDCHRRGDEFRGVLASLEANMQNTEELLREGRLNRSTRAQAIKMLRSGVEPETAAGALGMAAREVRLLSRVSELMLR